MLLEPRQAGRIARGVGLVDKIEHVNANLIEATHRFEDPHVVPLPRPLCGRTRQVVISEALMCHLQRMRLVVAAHVETARREAAICRAARQRCEWVVSERFEALDLQPRE